MCDVLHTVLETKAYLAKASKLMSDDERQAVVDTVSRTPFAGDLIKGTRGLRKVRVALQGRGTSGGARVIYWFHSERYPVALLWIFAKNEASNLTAKQAAILAEIGDDMIGAIGANQ